MASQVQFYMALPLLLLLLRPQAAGLYERLAMASGAIIVGVTAYRAAIALRLQLPVPVFGPLDSPEMLQLMTRTLRVSYYSLLPRLSHLSFGLLGACALPGAGSRSGLAVGMVRALCSGLCDTERPPRCDNRRAVLISKGRVPACRRRGGGLQALERRQRRP